MSNVFCNHLIVFKFNYIQLKEEKIAFFAVFHAKKMAVKFNASIDACVMQQKKMARGC